MRPEGRSLVMSTIHHVNRLFFGDIIRYFFKNSFQNKERYFWIWKEEILHFILMNHYYNLQKINLIKSFFLGRCRSAFLSIIKREKKFSLCFIFNECFCCPEMFRLLSFLIPYKKITSVEKVFILIVEKWNQQLKLKWWDFNKQ